MEQFMEVMGTDGFSTILVIGLLGLMGFIIWKYVLGNKDTSMLKKLKSRKIVMLEAATVMLIMVGALNAAWVSASGENEMPFGIRLGTHTTFGVIAALLLFGLFQEFKEAFDSFKVLMKFVDDKDNMNWSYGVAIFFNFLMQWVQALGMLVGGIACQVVNLLLMAAATDEIYLLTAEYGYGWVSLTEGYFSLALASEYIICAIAHPALFLLIGVFTYDSSIKQYANGAKKSKPTGRVVKHDDMLKYFARNAYSRTEGYASSDIKAMLEYDATEQYSNQAAMETLVYRALDARDIVEKTPHADDPDGSKRQKAGDELKVIHKAMRDLMDDISDKMVEAEKALGDDDDDDEEDDDDGIGGGSG